MKNSAEKIGAIRAMLANGIWSEHSDVIIKMFVTYDYIYLINVY